MSIRRETIAVEGTVMYCDGCGRRGPEAAYDNGDDVIDAAEADGWTQDDDDRDLCPECAKSPPPAAKKRKG